jgi:hypothetical protein
MEMAFGLGIDIHILRIDLSSTPAWLRLADVHMQQDPRIILVWQASRFSGLDWALMYI